MEASLVPCCALPEYALHCVAFEQGHTRDHCCPDVNGNILAYNVKSLLTRAAYCPVTGM